MKNFFLEVSGDAFEKEKVNQELPPHFTNKGICTSLIYVVGRCQRTGITRVRTGTERLEKSFWKRYGDAFEKERNPKDKSTVVSVLGR
jgi:hypothetical protein